MSELYLFNNNGVNLGFTPTVFSKTLSGITYSPAIISRSNLNITENFAKSFMTFKFERTHSFANTLVSEIPEIPIIVTIFRNNLTYWKGQVLSAKKNFTSIEVACDSTFVATSKSGLRYRANLTCNHILYGGNCGVIKSNFATTGTATATSTIINVSGISNPDGFFENGIAEMAGQSRRILTQIGTVITLSSPFTGVLSGIIQLFPGCKLTEANCITPFNNLVNLGAFTRIPSKNPFSNTGLL
jgi:hypothetical protein